MSDGQTSPAPDDPAPPPDIPEPVPSPDPSPSPQPPPGTPNPGPSADADHPLEADYPDGEDESDISPADETDDQHTTFEQQQTDELEKRETPLH